MSPATATPASRLRLGCCMVRPSPRPSLLSIHTLGTEVAGHHQQARGFRLGPWSTSGHVHVRRRQHALRYRYMESLNRYLNGSIDSSIPDCMSASRSWRVHRSPNDGAYANMDDIKSWSDDISGLRPSNATDRVEAESLDHLYAPTGGASKQHSPWVSFHYIRKYLLKRPRPPDATSKSDLDAPTSKRVQEDFIDPITNRRVRKPTTTTAAASAFSPEYRTHKGLDGNTPDEWRESQGSPQHASQNENSIYDAQRKYSGDKPNGRLAPLQPSGKDTWKNLADLAKYKPVSATESRTEPGKPSKELFKGYDDLERVRIGLRNKPDDICKPVLKGPSKNSPDLDKYGPVYFNEPDGRQDWTAEEVSSQNKALDQYKKLHQYKVPFVVDDAILAAHEQGQQIFAPKAEPISTKMEVPCDGPAQQYTDLGKYGPVYWNEPDVFRSSNQSLGIGSHYSVTEPASRLAPSRGADSVGRCNEPASKVYTSLSRDGFEAHRKSTESCSDAAASNRTIIDANRPSRSPTVDLLDQDCDESDRVHGGLPEAGRDSGDFKTGADIRADVLRRARNDKERAELQQAKSEHDLNWDATSKDAQDALKQLKMKTERSLTGNYVRDFPQDLAASWSTANSPSTTTLVPKNGSEGAQPAAAFSDTPNMERDGAEPSSMDESFPSEETRLEPFLDGQPRRSWATTATSRLDKQDAEEDLYSKVPQGLETSYVRECGGQTTSPLQAKHYEVKTAAEPKDAPTGGGQSVSYRVLAYDSATGTLSMAETTSGVEDMQTWASPAAVLPRLSSPSKFLAHFARLDEQGYEIVAGGGDVLVFGKVRAASTGQPSESLRAEKAPAKPIDVMGKPVTGNFASPTGFVNYDGPAGLDESTPSPGFQRSEGVAGEERRGGMHDGRGRKRGFGRKLVMGTVWVTGIAYAAGVLGEYFATGGADGRGPRGF